jgi:transposase
MQSTMLTNKITDFEGQPFYVGLDVHKKSWSVTVRTLGFEVAHFTQSPDAEQLARYLRNRYPGGEFRYAYEAGFCGTQHHYNLCEAGITNIIINPADLPKTDKHTNNKTDLHDSRATARYLEAGVLRGIHIMPVDQQERRSLFRSRQIKVRDVTRCNNRLRSFIHFFGIQLPEEYRDKDYLSNRFLKWLCTIPMTTPQGMQTLHQYIQDLEYQRKQLLGLTKLLRQAIAVTYPEQYASLLTVPGVGAVTAMALLAETGELGRFNDPDQFASYLGLLPAERSSGNTVYSVKMQPRCNKYLRPLLIEAAWVAIRKCPVILKYYKKHVAVNNKKAIVKVARKLAMIAKSVAINKSNYQSNYETQKSI